MPVSRQFTCTPATPSKRKSKASACCAIRWKRRSDLKDSAPGAIMPRATLVAAERPRHVTTRSVVTRVMLFLVAPRSHAPRGNASRPLRGHERRRPRRHDRAGASRGRGAAAARYHAERGNEDNGESPAASRAAAEANPKGDGGGLDNDHIPIGPH